MTRAAFLAILAPSAPVVFAAAFIISPQAAVPLMHVAPKIAANHQAPHPYHLRAGCPGHAAEKPVISSLLLSSPASTEADVPRRESGGLPAVIRAATLFAPLWTILAAAIGLSWADMVGPALGSLPVVSRSLSVLMLAMGLTITPAEFSRAVRSPGVVALNVACCFVIMPLLSVLVAKMLCCDREQTIGTVLLGCVSGGQASNLFALLAGGDVSLSVVCTLSTTLLGVAATPLLVKWLLGCSIAVDGVGVLKSVASLVLGPLSTGLALRLVAPNLVARVAPICPAIGVGATLLLVAGGAANSAASLIGSVAWKTAASSSVLLPLFGGAVALMLSLICRMSESSKRTLVVEVLSKSPTLAYVIALKHFDSGAAAVPAAAMVSLAAVGAAVASSWTLPVFNDIDSTR